MSKRPFFMLLIASFSLIACQQDVVAPTQQVDGQNQIAAKSANYPKVEFDTVQFGTGGGLTGRGMGSFVRLTGDGRLTAVERITTHTDSGDFFLGKTDTIRKIVDSATLAYADSILRCEAVRHPELDSTPKPDNGQVIYDGFYWLASATFRDGKTQSWSDGARACSSPDGDPAICISSLAVRTLQALEVRLLTIVHPLD